MHKDILQFAEKENKVDLLLSAFDEQKDLQC